MGRQTLYLTDKEKTDARTKSNLSAYHKKGELAKLRNKLYYYRRALKQRPDKQEKYNEKIQELESLIKPLAEEYHKNKQLQKELKQNEKDLKQDEKD